jgi:hypothetical protein
MVPADITTGRGLSAPLIHTTHGKPLSESLPFGSSAKELNELSLIDESPSNHSFVKAQKGSQALFLFPNRPCHTRKEPDAERPQFRRASNTRVNPTSTSDPERQQDRAPRTALTRVPSNAYATLRHR